MTEAKMVCAGCGWTAPAGDPMPFGCAAARAGDDIDHVLAAEIAAGPFPSDPDPNPYVAYIERFYSTHYARRRGLGDDDVVARVRDLDAAVASVDGRGFTTTPLRRVGPYWAKDESKGVGGSHKARHLFGVMHHLRIAEVSPRPLAIASCGNAALAAAIVARAAQWPLDVYVPTDASLATVARLTELGARIHVCARDGAPGDPCYRAFRAAVANGAIPFSCQGPDNGMAVESGKTLGYELAHQIREGPGRIDRLFVQVGGGALASACIQALREAVAHGVLAALPRVHAVQTEAAHPLVRAYHRAVSDGANPTIMARNRSRYMWPWDTTPRSVAHGILDDETYDWLVIVAAMLETGGEPITVGEDALRTAARATDTDATGAAGVAGYTKLSDATMIAPDEQCVVLLTGGRRDSLEG